MVDLLLSLSYRRGTTPWGPRAANFLQDYCSVWGFGAALHRVLGCRLATSGDLAKAWPSVFEDLSVLLSIVDPSAPPLDAPAPLAGVPAGAGARTSGPAGSAPAPLPPIRVPSMLRATSTGSASSATRTPIEQVCTLPAVCGTGRVF